MKNFGRQTTSQTPLRKSVSSTEERAEAERLRLAERTQSEIEGLRDDAFDNEERRQQRLVDLEQDTQNRILDIQRNANRSREDIERDFQDAYEDIQRQRVFGVDHR